MPPRKRRSDGATDPRAARQRLRGLTWWMWINVGAVLLILLFALLVTAIVADGP